MPVMTVPEPRMVKTSSTHTRNKPAQGRSSQAATTSFSASKKPVEAFAGDVGERADRRVGQKRAGQQPPQILRSPHSRRPASTRSILVERHQPVPQAHQREDVQVLVRLRHDAVVGGHDEDHHVDAVRAGDHVADEIHVAGHVHDADDALVGQPAGGEAEVNGQPALLSPRRACRSRSR